MIRKLGALVVLVVGLIVLAACEETTHKAAPAPSAAPDNPSDPPAVSPPAAPSQPESPPAAPGGESSPPDTPPDTPQGGPESVVPRPSFSGSAILNRNAKKGVAFSMTLPKATGGQGSLTYSFSCSSCGANGLQYADHVIRGTPTRDGVIVYAQYWATDERGYWTVPWIQITVTVAAAPLPQPQPQPTTANIVIMMSGIRYRTLEYLGTSEHDFSVRWSSMPSELRGTEFAVGIGIRNRLNIGSGRRCAAITLDKLSAFSTSGRLTASCLSGAPSTSEWSTFWNSLNNKSFTCNGATGNCTERK